MSWNPAVGCVAERVAGIDVDAGRGRCRVHAADDLEFGFVDGGADDGEQRVGHFVHELAELRLSRDPCHSTSP